MTMIYDDFVVESFKKDFEHLKKKPIALYGTGYITNLLITDKRLNDFNFSAIIDLNETHKNVFGHVVIPIEDAVKLADDIIIVSNLSSAPGIYERISPYLPNNINVWYMNGEYPKIYDNNLSDNEYFDINWEELFKTAANYDIISFDVFDTLLMRKCLYPEDVFLLLGQKMEKCGWIKNAEHFAAERKAAEKYCSRNISKTFTLNQIYDRVQEVLNLPYDCRLSIQDAEIDLEREVIIARKAFGEFIKKLKSVGKTIILASDMYLPKEAIKQFLIQNNIVGWDELYVSSDIGNNKYNGDMYRMFKEKYSGGGRILHIGDNEKVDGIVANEQGIDSKTIKSSRDLLSLSEFETVLTDKLKDNNTLISDIFKGLFASKLLNDPFILHGGRGRYIIKDIFDVGYIFWGPIIFCYMVWLIETTKKLSLDGLLFMSRDGYFLQRLLSEFMPYTPQNLWIRYFHTSRQAASVAGIETENDIRFVVKYMFNVNSLKFNKILESGFHISAELNDPFQNKTLGEIGKDDLVEALLSKYKSKIFDRAQKEREAYLDYMKELPIKQKTKVGCVNFIGRGLTQHFIYSLFKKIADVDLYGLYFARLVDALEIYQEPKKILSAFGDKETIHTSKLNLVKHILDGEMLLSSPAGTVKYLTNEPKRVVFADKYNDDFDAIKRCHEGIRYYIKDFLTLYKMPSFSDLNVTLADNMLGALFSPCCKQDKNLKFNFSDPYGGKK